MIIRAPALRAVAPAPKVFCILSTPPMRGRPATNRPYPAAPVRLRRPYNAENYFPRPLQRVEPLSLQILPALACGLC